MIRTLAFGALLAFGLSSVANAAFLPAPIETGVVGIVKVAEDCGENRWRDEYGHCHWFKNRFGTDRGTRHACPTWAHDQDGRCVHN